MAKKDKHIVQYTFDNLPKSKTDFAKLKAMSEEEIEAAAQADPDNPPWTDEMLATAYHWKPQKKVSIHMYLDEDIVKWFKQEGKGYQRRINAVLKSYIHHHSAG